MTRLNQVFVFPLVVTFLFLMGTGQQNARAQDQDQKEPLQQLRERFKSGKIFHARFIHTYEDAYTGKRQESSGKVWVGGSEYKVIGENQRVLVYEGLSRVYDENRNRVVISDYEPQEDDFAPSKFLTGTDTLYTVAEQETVKDTVRITLESDDSFTVFKHIEIKLEQSLTPLQIKAVDQAGNQVITRFERGTFVEREKDIFNLNYPEDAKIIDLRE